MKDWFFPIALVVLLTAALFWPRPNRVVYTLEGPVKMRANATCVWFDAPPDITVHWVRIGNRTYDGLPEMICVNQTGEIVINFSINGAWALERAYWG